MKLETRLKFDMEIKLPRVYPVRQRFEDRSIVDVAGAVRRAIEEEGLLKRLEPGIEVAITAGSRGIDRIADVLFEAGRCVREAGGSPFVVPAMGSHGGATAEGQVALLAEMGVTEASVNMPIRSSMDTVEIARAMDGTPALMDAIASKAGGILIINRVKPHTSMVGPHQSGIVKMLVVGLGKRDGAEVFHHRGPAEMARILPVIAEEIITRMPIIGGIGLIEDAFDHLSLIRAVKLEKFLETDHEMLKTASSFMARLPFDDIDVLVVDEIGKDISGTGMDTNVIGRMGVRTYPDLPKPRITRIVALALSDKTMGNAHGVGMADMVTEKLVGRIDWNATRANALTTHFPEKALLPLSFPTAREAVVAALGTCWAADPTKARLVRIRNTKELDKLLVSESFLPEVESNPNLEISGPVEDLKL